MFQVEETASMKVKLVKGNNEKTNCCPWVCLVRDGLVRETWEVIVCWEVGPCPLNSRKQSRVFLSKVCPWIGFLQLINLGTTWKLDWSEDRLRTS